MTLKPLHLKAPTVEEVDLLRDIFRLAKGRYYEQKDFLSKSDTAPGDIRYFLNKSGRPKPEFLNRLYDFVLGTAPGNLRETVPNTDGPLYDKIKRLYALAIQTGRLDHDINFYMSKAVESDIQSFNVPESECGYFIGYRYRTDKVNLLRFLVHIFLDSEVQRTRFRSFLQLENSVRDTRGFAYHPPKTANIYLSGIMNNQLGCEFIATRTVMDPHVRSGLIITTDSKGLPAAKQCILIDIHHTRYASMLTDPMAFNLSHPLLQEMKPVHPSGTAHDIIEQVRYSRDIRRLLQAAEMIDIPTG